MKKLINKLGLLLGTSMILLLAAITLFPINAKAALADGAYDYYFGETFEGNGTRTWAFTLTKESNVYFCYKLTNTTLYYTSSLELYDSNGKKYLNRDDFKKSYNLAKELHTYTCTHILPKGQYYLVIKPDAGGQNYPWSFFATSEPSIKLSKPSITKLTNPSTKRMYVKYSEISNTTGYEVQYALNTAFTKGKRTLKVGSNNKSVAGLTKGKTYYVRVRAYAVYGAGNKVYSPWSVVKQVKITK